MAIQLILCVETNKKADTDSKYIFETIRYYYNVDNSVKLSKIYMGTKTKYNSKEVLKEIKQKKSMFSHGSSMVIYCIDTDQYEKNPNHKKNMMKFKNIVNMRIMNWYGFVMMLKRSL